MEEQVIHEMRVIETDNGYRIEINGDKDAIRRMPFMRMILEGRGWSRRRGKGRGRGRGRRYGEHRHDEEDEGVRV